MMNSRSSGGFYRNMPIALRLGLVVGMALLAFGAAVIVYMGGEATIGKARARSIHFSQFAEKAEQAQTTFQSLKYQLLRFTGRHDVTAAQTYKEDLAAIKNNLVALTEIAGKRHPEFLALLESLSSKVAGLQDHFDKVEGLIHRQGFNADEGLWRSLNESVKAVEKETSAWPNTGNLKAKLAIMRSYEADFMLRKDLVALQKHKKTFNEFDFTLWEVDFDKQTRDLFTKLITRYRKDLEIFAEVDQQVGDSVAALDGAIVETVPLFAQLFAVTREGIANARNKVEQTKAETERSIAIAVGLVLTLYCMLSFLMARSLTAPLNRMRAAMKRLAAGDVSTEIADLDRGDEIGGMAQAVAVFKDGLIRAERLTEEKERAAIAREKRQATLESAIARFKGGIADVLASIDHASSGMDQTATGITSAAHQTHNQVDQAAMNSVEASESVRAVAQATEELATALTAISQRVNASARVTRIAKQKAGLSKERINSLLMATGRVTEILELIQGIADKTRLLSLNANIEATRAGAAGEGFAVVAREVKDLAAQTAQATKMVNAQISGITREADNAMGAIDSVVESIGEASLQSEEIARVILDQERTTKLIAHNVQTASDSATNATDTISHVKNAAQGTKKVANDVSSASAVLARHSRDLRHEVEDFLTGIRAA